MDTVVGKFIAAQKGEKSLFEGNPDHTEILGLSHDCRTRWITEST